MYYYRRVLSFILSEKDREEVVDEIHSYLETVGKEIREGSIPLEKFVINKVKRKRKVKFFILLIYFFFFFS